MGGACAHTRCRSFIRAFARSRCPIDRPPPHSVTKLSKAVKDEPGPRGSGTHSFARPESHCARPPVCVGCRERAAEAAEQSTQMHHRRAGWHPITGLPPLPDAAFEAPAARGLLLWAPPLAQAAGLRLDHLRARFGHARLGRGPGRLAVVPPAAGFEPARPQQASVERRGFGLRIPPERQLQLGREVLAQPSLPAGQRDLQRPAERLPLRGAGRRADGEEGARRAGRGRDGPRSRTAPPSAWARWRPPGRICATASSVERAS